MLFAHDTECSLIATAALVNTAGRDGELLPDVAALDAFFVRHSYSGRHERTDAELRAVKDLRPQLRRIWHAEPPEIVALVNGLLLEHKALPQLIEHDDEPYHLHAVPRDAPLATRIAVEAAMAMADLVRARELSRLRICEYPDCDNVVVDLSRNRSRRFCEAGCGNRAAVTAYRARRAAGRS
ncbi:CGNR zinc finger domain-containing protein [Micromonospora chokoriensis]